MTAKKKVPEAPQPPVVVVAPLEPITSQPKTEAAQSAVNAFAVSDLPSYVIPSELDLVGALPAEAAQLAGVSEQAIRKAISSGRIPSKVRVCTSGFNKGRTEYRVQWEDVFNAYPKAREAWEASQAEARRIHEAQIVHAPRPLYKRDAQQVVLRAHPAAMTKAQTVMNARLQLMDAAVRPLVRELGEDDLRRTRVGLPSRILEEAVAWLVGSEEGRAVLVKMGKVPSSETINRWWKAYREDPSGLALKPKAFAAGRERLTDKDPRLEEEILGAYSFRKSFRGAAEVLQERGFDISENTVRRFFAGMDKVVVASILKGERKALTDYGPYVRRRPSRPFQCWSIDGHTWDALTLWDTPLEGEELKPFRPKIYMVRDVGAGGYIGLQLGNSLNQYLVYMAIAEAIIRTGVIPETIQTDNGSEVKNALFLGDEDTYGYFDQLGMNWKNSQALWRAALPYNSRSKPIERDFRTLSENMAARLPAYVGGSPSRRPGAPLQQAHAAGAYETVASLKEKLAEWLQDRLQRVRTVQRHQIKPIAALAQARQRLVEELGADHPRFVREGQEWRVLPSLKGRLVRGFVEARIEGQVLRFHSPILDTLKVDGLEVRLWPWDVSKAWLCRAGELLDQLSFIPDAPELGSGTVDVVALRYAKLLERRQKGLIKAAQRGADALQKEAGMHGLRLGSLVLSSEPSRISKVDDIEPAELERQREAMALETKKIRPEESVDRYRRLLLLTDPEDLTDADRAWITEFEKTSEGKSLREVVTDYRRDGAAR